MMRGGVVIAVIAVGFVAGWACRQPSAVKMHDGDAVSGLVASVARLSREIETMHRELSALHAQPAVAAIRDSLATADPSSLEAVLAELSNLRGQVAEFLAVESDRASFPVATPAVRQKSLPAVLDAMSRCAAEVDEEDPRYFCWTRRQVYDHFGRPDSTTWSGRDTTWEYRTGDGTGGLIVSFVDGLVTGVWRKG